MNVITISREFGSGGREVGKRLADTLGYTYFDREIEIGIATRMNMDIHYITHALNHGAFINLPLHFGKTFASPYMIKQQVDLLVEKQRLLKEIASSSNCVIVGRAADAILSEYSPFKIFVYADMAYKIKRCQGYAEVEENLPSREMEKAIKKIDSKRSQYHRMHSDVGWGIKEQYHLCINTTGLEIKKMIPSIAEYTRRWFETNG